MSQSEIDTCDSSGKSGQAKFICIHKKKQMSKGTNIARLKKIWVPKSLIIHIVDILGRKRLGFKLVLGKWLLMTHDMGKVYVPQSKAT